MKTYQLLENTDIAVNDDVVDKLEPVVEHTRELAVVMARLMVFLISGGTASSIGARTMVLAQALNLDLGNNIKSFEDIAKASGLTRSAVSAVANELRDTFGLQSYNNRPESNRDNCRKAQL